MNIPRNEHIAWVAGLLEREGTFAAYKSKKAARPQLRVALRMTDLDVVEKFAEIIKTNAKITIEKPRENCKEVFSITINGENAESLMYLIYSYMSNRRQEKIKEILNQDLSHHPKRSCPHGHSYGGINLYISPSGEIRCKICYNIRRKKWRDAKELVVR